MRSDITTFVLIYHGLLQRGLMQKKYDRSYVHVILMFLEHNSLFTLN